MVCNTIETSSLVHSLAPSRSRCVRERICFPSLARTLAVGSLPPRHPLCGDPVPEIGIDDIRYAPNRYLKGKSAMKRGEGEREEEERPRKKEVRKRRARERQLPDGIEHRIARFADAVLTSRCPKRLLIGAAYNTRVPSYWL
ncbi:PREDICTED: uncharacterized protein LOC106748998 [Dinoponera quadriceps]|uniref:Uncharacterized protein LOC106748998 n=1 Tax=Dinoponera quadriceps TaxID=609295 RepID=A0A6P3XZH5_DINQU|nr:PREDICTED: uncharacterized protein LOC106748998 [Dinoponera quadriceps]